MNERETLYIYYTVVASVIFLTLVFFVIKASNDDLFRQKSVVADLALGIDSVLAANGDLITKENLNEYNLDINDCNLIVRNKKNQELETYYNCVKNNGVEMASLNDLHDEITFEKTGNKVIIK